MSSNTNNPPKNPGKTTDFDDICTFCDPYDIIPFYPVRYALGEFNVNSTQLEYPALEALANNNYAAQSGMVTRLLRSGFVYIYADDGACEETKNHPSAAPSFQDHWHIFYYTSPNQEEKATYSDDTILPGIENLAGKFVKCELIKNEQGQLTYQRFKDREKKSDVIEDYVFIPLGFSKIHIAYSASAWSPYMLETLLSDSGKCADYMQEVGTMLPAQELFSLPLQLDQGVAPVNYDAKKPIPNLDFSPSNFVQELKSPLKIEETAESPLEKLILSNCFAQGHSSERLAKMQQRMSKKSEIGKVIALYDPVGIGQDLNILHTTAATSHANDIMENTYAYATFQAVESELAGALPPDNTFLGSQLQNSRDLVAGYRAQVDKQIASANKGLRKRDQMLSAQGRIARRVREDMSEAEQKVLAAAQKIVDANAPTDDQSDAKAALGPDFDKVRKKMIAQSKEQQQQIDKVCQRIKKWSERSGVGSINNRIELLQQQTYASTEVDQAIALIDLLKTLTSLTTGLESSPQGKKQLDQLLFSGDINSKGPWYYAAGVIKASMHWVGDTLEQAEHVLSHIFHDVQAPYGELRGSVSAFLAPLANSPTLSANFVNDLGIISDGKKIADTTSIRVLEGLYKLLGSKLSFKLFTLEELLASFENHGSDVDKWQNSSLRKLYSGVMDKELNLFSLDGKPAHFHHSHLKMLGFGGAVLASTVFGLIAANKGLSTIQSRSGHTASVMLSPLISKLYYSLILAEASALVLKKDLNNIIGKGAKYVLQKSGIAASEVIGKTLEKNVPTQTAERVYTAAGKVANNKLVQTSLKIVTGLLKVSPILGAIDAMTNYHKYIDLKDRGDTDAAVFAGIGVAGGSMIVLAALCGPLGWAAGAAYLTGAAVVFIITSVVGLIFATDTALVNWINNGFWGGKKGFFGTPNYLYWDEVEREDIEIIYKNGLLVPKFDAQITIASLINYRGEEISETTPQIDSKRVALFMEREMSEYHNQIYLPTITSSRTGLKVFLPGFVAGKSELHLSVSVQVEGFHGANRLYGTQTYQHEYDLPGDNDRFWQATDNPFVFIFPEYSNLDSVVEREKAVP